MWKKDGERRREKTFKYPFLCSLISAAHFHSRDMELGLLITIQVSLGNRPRCYRGDTRHLKKVIIRATLYNHTLK